jgi:hypothetical protein
MNRGDSVREKTGKSKDREKNRESFLWKTTCRRTGSDRMIITGITAKNPRVGNCASNKSPLNDSGGEFKKGKAQSRRGFNTFNADADN